MYSDIVSLLPLNNEWPNLYLARAVAIVETVVFSVLLNSFYSFAIDFVIGKRRRFSSIIGFTDFLGVYANSLLAVLNSRATLRAEVREGCSDTEMSTRFNIASSAVANHQTSLIQVRSE